MESTSKGYFKGFGRLIQHWFIIGFIRLFGNIKRTQ